MKIHVVGGGPAGLYFAILMKKREPAHAITLFERDGPNDTFGWGIVFSDRTYTFLRDHDPETYADITAASEVWDNVDVVHRGQKVSVRGNRFSGIGRLAFLNILQARCRALGVDVRFHQNVAGVGPPDEVAACDLLVGADGANSLVRRTYTDFFLPSVDVRQNKYLWLGTSQLFHGLTIGFREADAGLFIYHAYKFNPTTSTFIVECPPETWARAGLERMSDEETCAYLAHVFKADLGGHPLLSNNFVKWLNFPLVKNKHWSHRHIVLLGDALHTAHFSIGSGTKLALEDAIALAGCFAGQRRVEAALVEFQRVRKPVVDEFQEAAYASLLWLEQVGDYLDLAPIPFAYRLMTRSRRVGYHRLQRKDPEFTARYDAWRREQPPAGPIPSEFLDLFQKRTYAHLATLMPDGTPHLTPVWVDYDGRHILVNSAAGRQKDLNMDNRRQVAIEIPDPDNPNRYLAVRGPVVEITEQGAEAHLDRLAQRYLGTETYPASWRFPGEVRRIYKIAPKRVTTWDPFG
ncbi:MAG TPA: TIGR03618 family F420-dependent PPOX class oxidoreductase [Methylomirabilota bacterium]|jgi:anthraniloyl-CoA monooxygenase|nr:TIGR03618 family F420-dependent PPOX class oxidoreductase [Methylomirabilota bacterium]